MQVCVVWVVVVEASRRCERTADSCASIFVRVCGVVRAKGASVEWHVQIKRVFTRLEWVCEACARCTARVWGVERCRGIKCVVCVTTSRVCGVVRVVCCDESSYAWACSGVGILHRIVGKLVRYKKNFFSTSVKF